MRCPACHRRLAPEAACPRHPAERAPAAPPQPPGFLGGGGFGVVLLEHRDGVEVAVKVAHGAGAPRFAREAEALRRIGPPSVPALLAEERRPDGKPALVLERLRGETLADLLAERGALPVEGAVALGRALAAALERVHAAGVVHRDVKPENIFLAGERVALLDLGLARFSGEAEETEAALSLTRTGAVLGTPAYLAPEQAGAARLCDARSDVYALGAVLFELVAGRPPFVGDEGSMIQGHLSRRPPRLGALVDAPAWLDDVVMRCLAKEPGERPQSMRSLGELLAAAPSPPPAPAAAPAARAVSSQRQPVVLLSVAGGADLPRVTELVAAEGGQLIGLKADRLLFGVAGGAGVRGALRAARHLAEAGLASAIHVAELRVRGRAILGAAVDRPDEWLPRTAAPIVLTAAAAALLDEGEVAAQGDGFVPAAASQAATTGVGAAALRGRDALLAAVLADARPGATPTLTTVLGEMGMGKSRFLQAVGERLAGATLLRAPPFDGDREALLRALLRLAFGLPHDASAEEARAAAGPAVAHALGLLPADDPAVAPLLVTPGALRQVLAKAGGDALRARAPLTLLVDEGHSADPVSLDMLEIATLSGHGAAIFVCVAARPALVEARPTWATRAGRATQHVLTPLEPADARALVRDLLSFVEFIPDDVVTALVERGAGSPGDYVELAHALRSERVLRPSGDAWLVAAGDLARVGATALPERLARRAVAGLRDELARLAVVVAVLGRPVTVAEVDAVLAAAALPAELDTGVALRRLLDAGLLRRPDAGRHAYRHPMIRDAVEAQAAPELRRTIHETAYQLLAATQSARAHLARHAAAAGRWREAAAAHLELADEARARGRFIEAEQHYGAALEQLALGGSGGERMRALGGRGRMRYRSGNHAGALDDLLAARELAEAQGDEAAMVDLTLEMATVHDELGEWMLAIEMAEPLAELVERLADPRLRARWRLAIGRGRLRQGRIADGLDSLERANADAALAADVEARTITLLLLAYFLAVTGRYEDAEARFAEVAAMCEASGDRYHLNSVLNNRPILDRALGRFDDVRRHLERAVEIARELGNPAKERTPTYNLAQHLHWQGENDEALRLARRCFDLMVRFFPDSLVEHDAMLMVRILVELGRHTDASELLDWIRAHCPSLAPVQEVYVQFGRLATRAQPATDEVERLVAHAARHVWDDVEDLCEIVGYWSARVGGELAVRWSAVVPAHVCARRTRA